MQTTFIKAYDDHRRFRPGTSLSMALPCYSTCVGCLRHRKRQLVTPPPVAADPDYIGEDLRRARNPVARTARTGIQCGCIEQRSFDALAVIYGKPAATLRKRYERARKKLAQALQGTQQEGQEYETDNVHYAPSIKTIETPMYSVSPCANSAPAAAAVCRCAARHAFWPLSLLRFCWPGNCRSGYGAVLRRLERTLGQNVMIPDGLTTPVRQTQTIDGCTITLEDAIVSEDDVAVLYSFRYADDHRSTPFAHFPFGSATC